MDDETWVLCWVGRGSLGEGSSSGVGSVQCLGLCKLQKRERDLRFDL